VALSLFYATIYRETGAADTKDLAVYQDAYGFGMTAVALFIAIAFGVGCSTSVRASARSGRSPEDP
jgi:hypothetical protein